IYASSPRVHRRRIDVLSTAIALRPNRRLTDGALWFRDPYRHFRSRLVDHVAGIVVEDRLMGVHEFDVETVAVVEVLEAILSRMAKIAGAVRRGSEPLTIL